MTNPQDLPWYGGNKIPDSYLAKFLPSEGSPHQDLPYEIRLFMQGFDDEANTNNYKGRAR